MDVLTWIFRKYKLLPEMGFRLFRSPNPLLQPRICSTRCSTFSLFRTLENQPLKSCSSFSPRKVISFSCVELKDRTIFGWELLCYVTGYHITSYLHHHIAEETRWQSSQRGGVVIYDLGHEFDRNDRVAETFNLRLWLEHSFFDDSTSAFFDVKLCKC